MKPTKLPDAQQGSQPQRTPGTVSIVCPKDLCHRQFDAPLEQAQIVNGPLYCVMVQPHTAPFQCPSCGTLFLWQVTGVQNINLRAIQMDVQPELFLPSGQPIQ